MGSYFDSERFFGQFHVNLTAVSSRSEQPISAHVTQTVRSSMCEMKDSDDDERAQLRSNLDRPSSLSESAIDLRKLVNRELSQIDRGLRDEERTRFERSCSFVVVRVFHLAH